MKRIIKEDSKMEDGHKRQMGLNKPESNVKSNLVGNLVDTNNENQVATPPLPFALSQFDSIATDLFIQTLNLRKMVDMVKSNPETYRRNRSKIDKLQTQLENIGELVVEVSNIVNTITQ